MKSAVLISLGIFLLILGTLGLLVPVFPTTPFVILAAGCFCGSSPTLHGWLLNTRFFGPYIRNYKQKTGISRKLKVQSLVFLWVMLGISMAVTRSLPMILILSLIGIAVTIHIYMIRRA